jgi:hypothetical protein
MPPPAARRGRFRTGHREFVAVQQSPAAVVREPPRSTSCGTRYRFGRNAIVRAAPHSRPCHHVIQPRPSMSSHDPEDAGSCGETQTRSPSRSTTTPRRPPRPRSSTRALKARPRCSSTICTRACIPSIRAGRKTAAAATDATTPAAARGGCALARDQPGAGCRGGARRGAQQQLGTRTPPAPRGHRLLRSLARRAMRTLVSSTAAPSRVAVGTRRRPRAGIAGR